jgi:hypothetical protein
MGLIFDLLYEWRVFWEGSDMTFCMCLHLNLVSVNHRAILKIFPQLMPQLDSAMSAYPPLR